MGPTTYALCQKPAIGLVMFLATLCEFPPLVQRAPISLEAQGASASGSFTVPVDKSYEFDLGFEFPTGEAILKDQVVGANYSKYCEGNASYQDIPPAQKADLGHPIPLQVVVRSKGDGHVVLDQTFHSLCMFASGARPFIKWRKIGQVALVRGEYSFDIKNLEPQAGLNGIHTYVSLVSGHGK